jgi:peptidyl-prolyl cis-trans isomerase D
MLQSIHKNMKWIMWSIVILVTVTFMFFGIYPSSMRGGTVAKVNGYVISADDLNRTYLNMEENYRRIMKGQMPENFSKILRAQALRELVQDRLLVQEADRIGLSVSDEELQTYIMQIPAFVERGTFNKRAYEGALQNINMTPAVFETSQREYLLRQKLEQLVEDGVAVTDAELSAAYAAKNPKAKPGDFEKNKVSFKQTYLAEKQRNALDAFVKGLENKATITIKDKAFAS